MSSVVWLSDPGKGLVRNVRQGQIRMAKHVEACVEEGGIVIVQGGTGTGKGMASLVPLCASGKVKRAVYSTAKKTLQRQILDDIPVVAERVRARRYAKRVGKGNYACAVRAEEFREEQAHRFDPAQVAEFFAWMGTTDYDELSEYGYKLPFESSVRVSECLKHKCPKRRECGYLASIQAAKEAEILVVNHALLAYDLAVGGGKVLGQYDALIIDEAHQATESFRSAHTLRWHPAQARSLEFGMKVDPRLKFPQELHEIYKEIGHHLNATRDGVFRVLGRDTEEPFRDMRDTLTDVKEQLISYGLWSEPSGEDSADEEDEQELSPEEARARARTRVVASQVSRLLKLTKVLLAEPETQYDPETGDALAHGKEGVEYLTYVECQKEGPSELVVTPIEVGPLVAPGLRKIGKVVITSATIATGNNPEVAFDYTMRQFGLTDSMLRAKDIVPSPFDYKNCSVLYVDKTAPLKPSGAGAREGLGDWFKNIGARIHKFLLASKGGAFILCASREDLDGIAEALRNYTTDEYRLGIQERSDDASVAWFKENPRSVLLGLKSLWEGVDVPGMGLRLVIVPRLPFPNQGDVLLQTRKERYGRTLVRQGISPDKLGYRTFSAFDVNICAQELAQGFGRLIRREGDMGTAVCLDPRLATKPYAGILQASIPIPLGPDDEARVLRNVAMIAKAAGVK